MDDSLISPDAQYAPLPYQLTKSFGDAVRQGESSRALALIEWMRATKNQSFFSHSGEGSLLQWVLDPQFHPDHPVDIELVKALLEAGAPANSLVSGGPGPLTFAALGGSLPAIELILANGAEINENLSARSRYQGEIKPLLVHAIEAGHSDIALHLLEVGADPHGAPEYPRPLQAAARKGDIQVTQALLARGVDVNAQFPDEIKPPNTGASYAPSVTALIEASKMDGNPVLPLLLAAGANVNAHSDNKGSALHEAISTVIYKPNPDPSGINAQRLLEAGADPNHPDQYGASPLSKALFNLKFVDEKGHHPHRKLVHHMMKLLLDHGANPDTSIYPPPGSVTPLFHLCDDRDAEGVLLLLRAGARADLREMTGFWLLNENSDDPLLREITMFLKERGLEMTPEEQVHALDEAASQGNAEHARVLLQRGTPIDTINWRGKTPLHEASANCHLEVVRLLLSNGAKIEATNEKGETPLHIASANRDVEIVQELLNAGANVNARNSTQSTPLIRAATAGTRRIDERDREIFKLTNQLIEELERWVSERCVTTVQLLLEAGSKVNDANWAGRTALHVAAKTGFPPIVACLLKAGADANLTDTDQETPLHLFLLNTNRSQLLEKEPYLLRFIFQRPSPEHFPERATNVDKQQVLLNSKDAADIEILNLLISYGVDVNRRGYRDFTPLHRAVVTTPELVRRLLTAGADPEATVLGATPLQCVFFLGSTDALLTKEGFHRRDFPEIREKLLVAAHDLTIDAGALFPTGTSDLNLAARDDVLMLRALLEAPSKT